jgi:hypothetical protein
VRHESGRPQRCYRIARAQRHDPPPLSSAPPFAFAAIAVICGHQSQRRGATRVFLLIAAYLELAVFALILGIGVNSINGWGYGN